MRKFDIFILISCGIGFCAGPCLAQNTTGGLLNTLQKKTGIPVPKPANSDVKALGKSDAGTARDRVDHQSVDLSFRNTSIAEALNMIARESRLRFQIEENVRGRITLNLKNINVWDALKIILDANRLAYYEKDDVILIMTAQEFHRRYGYDFDENEQARVIRLIYASPVDVVLRLNEIKSPTGKVLSDNLTDTIVILDSPDVVRRMLALIEKMDVPIETEVLVLEFAEAEDVIEDLKLRFPAIAVNMEINSRADTITLTDTASNIGKVRDAVKDLDIKKVVTFEIDIIRIILSEEHMTGIDWEAIVSDYKRLEETGTEEFGKNNFISVGTVTREDYPILKEALETVGKMEVFDGPDLIVENREPGLIFMKSTDGDVNITTSAPVVNLERIKNEDNFMDLTQAFQIIPVVKTGNIMDLTIRPIGKASDVDQAKLELEENDVVIIGSIFQQQSNTRIGKFPLLGDLPFLGFVFRSQHIEVLKLEHIIVLKPVVKVLSE